MLRDKILEVAKSYLGTPYSKLDCSAFVRAVFRQFDYELDRVSATQGKTLYNKGIAKRVSGTTTEIASKLQPGDLIWWANPKYTWRWLKIHHVGIYAGNGMIYDSAGVGVRFRSLWETSSWQIVLIADITNLLKYENEEGETVDIYVNEKLLGTAPEGALVTFKVSGGAIPTPVPVPNPVLKKVKYTGSGANIRALPKATGSKMGVAKNGDVFETKASTITKPYMAIIYNGNVAYAYNSGGTHFKYV